MKSLQEIKEANALKTYDIPPATVLDEAYKALLVAQASLLDVLNGPTRTHQRNNILNVDLPIINRAISKVRPL